MVSEHVSKFCSPPRVSTAGPTPQSVAQRLGIRRLGPLREPSDALPKTLLTHLSW